MPSLRWRPSRRQALEERIIRGSLGTSSPAAASPAGQAIVFLSNSQPNLSIEGFEGCPSPGGQFAGAAGPSEAVDGFRDEEVSVAPHGRPVLR